MYGYGVSWWRIVLVVVGLLDVAAIALAIVDRRRRTRAYREKVGLDLAELVALLPANLRTRSYRRFVVARSERDEVRVGLIYDADPRHRGNPPNVGLVFDRRTGALVSVCAEGLGLGLK